MEKTLKFTPKGVIVDFEAGTNPEVEPLFANHFELLQLNTDLFLDIGIITPKSFADAIEEAKRSTEPSVSLNFHVLQRIAMSLTTFLELRDKINTVYDQLNKANEKETQNGQAISPIKRS